MLFAWQMLWRRERERERRFRVYKEAPGIRPGPVRERRFRVYKEAPGFRPGPRGRDASACVRRHQAFALAPVRETLPPRV